LLVAGCVSSTTGPLKTDPNTDDAAQINYQLGARYYRSGKYELARDRLMLSIELNPKHAIVHSTLALTYEQLGNLRLASESYEEAVRIDPNNFDVQNAYAVFLCRQDRFDEALTRFNRAAKIIENDNSEITLTNAGVCMVQKPDYARAEDYFRQALERKPNYGEALLQLCLLMQEQGEYLRARAFLQRYLSSNMPSASVLYLGVQIEEELGDEHARTEFVNQILRDFPTSPEARSVLESG
jgi:type IV pilus assembly protein PilF